MYAKLLDGVEVDDESTKKGLGRPGFGKIRKHSKSEFDLDANDRDGKDKDEDKKDDTEEDFQEEREEIKHIVIDDDEIYSNERGFLKPLSNSEYVSISNKLNKRFGKLVSKIIS